LAEAKPIASQTTLTGITRRQFLFLGGVAATLVALGEVLGGVVAFMWPRLKAEAFGSKITLGTPDEVKRELPVNGAPLYFRDARFYLTRVDDGFLALYRKCPHLGCVVPWNKEEDQFHCPCHGSLFNRKGEVLGGPAPRPMDLMKIEVVGGQFVVDTGQIVQRSGYVPSQATQV